MRENMARKEKISAWGYGRFYLREGRKKFVVLFKIPANSRAIKGFHFSSSIPIVSWFVGRWAFMDQDDLAVKDKIGIAVPFFWRLVLFFRRKKNTIMKKVHRKFFMEIFYDE